MLKTPPGLLAVRRYFDSQESRWQSANKNDPWLWRVALALLALGLLLTLTGDQHSLFLSLNQFSQSVLPVYVWANITFIGDAMVAFTIGLLFTFRFPKLALAILLAGVIGTILVHTAKHLLELPRPPAVLDRDLFTIIGPAFKSNSMPSGHTATALTLVALLWRCVPNLQWRLALLAFGLLIGWSRVAAGIHWPADVCIGAALGLFASWLGLKLSDKLPLHRVTYGIVSAILITAAVMLFNFDGDFEQTALTAKLLSVATLVYWLGSWVIFFFAPKLILPKPLQEKLLDESQG